MKIYRHLPWLLLALFLLTGCIAGTIKLTGIVAKDEPPGVGAKAERGYLVCNPIIAALESYKAANGAYPVSLGELVPGTIASVPSRVNDQDIVYQRTETGYKLSFMYLGPGMNICTYSPEAGSEWDCSGAY